MRGLRENILSVKGQLIRLLCLVQKFFPNLFEAYSNLFKELNKLWLVYGRRKAIFVSPFLHISFFISLLIIAFKNDEYKWYNICTACLPSILGMSITGYALILNLGSDKFRDVIRGASDSWRDKPSPFMIASSSFAYFLIIQATTLIFAIICSAMELTNVFVTLIGTTFLIYSISLTVASILNTFFLSRLYDKMPK